MRFWIGVGAFAFALLCGFIARAASSNALYLLSGIGFLIAIVIAVQALPFWGALGLRLPPMPGLFRRPAPGQTWSTQEGAPVDPQTRVAKRRTKRN